MASFLSEPPLVMKAALDMFEEAAQLLTLFNSCRRACMINFVCLAVVLAILDDSVAAHNGFESGPLACMRSIPHWASRASLAFRNALQERDSQQINGMLRSGILKPPECSIMLKAHVVDASLSGWFGRVAEEQK